MQNNAEQQQTHQFWWSRPQKDGLGNRIKAIQKINDPTTSADEMLKGSKFFIILLLAFSGLLGGISYYKNFSGAFPAAAALFMAAALTVAIEWGKNYCATWALRLPFFHGFRHLGATPANTFMFIGLVGVSLATFAMSVYNSTRGGHQLSTMLSQERNSVAFAPNTDAIDQQIETCNRSIAANRAIQWKGTVTYQAQKAIQSQSRALENMHRQREATIQQQRADFERQQGQMDQNTSYTANLVMASGGWVEILQFLLFLFRVACEKALDGRSATRAPQEKAIIGFQRGPSPATAAAPTLPRDSAEIEDRRFIGFNRDEEGQTRSVAQVRAAQNTVAQPPQSVPQQSTQSSAMSADEIIRWHLSELQKEPSNFSNRQADKQTVMARIKRKMDTACAALNQLNAKDVTQEVGAKFHKFLWDKLSVVLQANEPQADVIASFKELNLAICWLHNWIGEGAQQ